MSSLRSSSVGVMRPPKPPCWRDFVVSSARSFATTDALDTFHDPSGRVLGSRSPVPDLLEPASSSRPAAFSSASGARPGRLARRPRARIHRTRSEHVILPEDLPDTGGASPLPRGIAAPEESRPTLRSRPRALTPDGQIDVEENNKRCQSWLASIEAAEPLDEVDYKSLGEIGQEQTVVSGVLLHRRISRRDSDFDLRDETEISKTNMDEEEYLSAELGQATVEMEIPEETFQWDEDVFPPSTTHRDTRPRSPTDSDKCQACKKASRDNAVPTTKTVTGSNNRKFTAPPLCGACTDCISCGSGEPLSSGASENNIHAGRAITVEDRSILCACLHSKTSSKFSNKRSSLRKSLSSKTPGCRPHKDRSTSSPAVTRSSGRIFHRGGGLGGGGGSVGGAESVSTSGPWQHVTLGSPGTSRRARSMSRRRASHKNVFRDKDVHL
ncbi:hypothetical protein RRG08_044093 [Elysia crispata]|uniref:Uncharacterized protein n=1 Tax=Elysia crispata TaxID=231223 RepID=A0AAE0Z784_9GAST|nr:hypothetical protein RRG08_044093 [Elysia crispata]